MKLLLENWREHLKEELLTEFARSDKEALMAEQDRFTISYEIELESQDKVGAKPGGRASLARNYLPEEYFSESLSEREAGDFYQHYLEEEDPEPSELIAKYLIEEYPTRVDPNSEEAEDLVKLSIAVKEEEAIAKEFSMLYKNMLREGTRENKALIAAINNSPNVKKALEKRGVEFKTARQGTLPFDDEAGEETVILGMQPDTLKEVVNTYFFSPENDNFFPLAAQDQAINLASFFSEAGWGEEHSDWIDEGGVQIKNFIIDGGNTRYPSISDLTYYNTNGWESYHLKQMAEMVSEAAQSFVDERAEADWREYQDDPEDYLDNMGYDWEESFHHNFPGTGDFYGMLEEHFPRFMEKWADQLKFEEDGSLRNGVEFSMDNPKFMTGLDTAFEFLKDFFYDYNRQDNFYFDANTGLHINIGYLDDDRESHKEYNLMKALLFLNHDFAFKEFGQRKGTRWALDLKSDFKEKIEREFKQARGEVRKYTDMVLKLYKENKLDELGKELSKYIEMSAPSNAKSLGFNIRYIDRLGYVEFRYPGGKQPTLENMRKATLYYAYVIKQAVDPAYKKKEYEQKLIKLMTGLASHVERPTEVKTVKALMKKGAIYLLPDFGGDRSLQHYITRILDAPFPAELRFSTAAIFKGIRKGKTLKDTEAIFKAVAHEFHDSPNMEVHKKYIEALNNPDAYSIEERLFSIPQLERMIVNKSLKPLKDTSEAKERVKDVFAAIEGKRLAPDQPAPIKENKIKIRLVKK